jgi:glycosyltransferase involved in cell wall biosynthesis
MPQVSVIIPSFNHGNYISEAVSSVLNQTEQDLEIIVVDDGSKDDSLKILGAFSDPRLRIIPQENQGAHAAINRGLREASSNIYAILNSDDSYAPERLAHVLQILKADPQAGLIGSYIEIINSKSSTLGIKHGYQDCSPWSLPHPDRSFRAGSNLHAALLTENYWSTTSNLVFRKSLYKQVGEFRALRYVHDWDFALRMAQQTKLVLVPEPLVRYRVHESNTIRENQVAMIFEICWCIAMNLPEYIQEHWHIESSASEQIERLYYSMYLFGMDRVLSLMLMQGLAANPNAALELLNPENSCRSAYLRIIAESLQH